MQNKAYTVDLSHFDFLWAQSNTARVDSYSMDHMRIMTYYYRPYYVAV